MNKLYELNDNDKILDYINKFNNSEIYHHPCWKNTLEEIFGYKSLYLANDNAYLPFMYMSSYFFQRKKLYHCPS